MLLLPNHPAETPHSHDVLLWERYYGNYGNYGNGSGQTNGYQQTRCGCPAAIAWVWVVQLCLARPGTCYDMQLCRSPQRGSSVVLFLTYQVSVLPPAGFPTFPYHFLQSEASPTPSYLQLEISATFLSSPPSSATGKCVACNSILISGCVTSVGPRSKERGRGREEGGEKARVEGGE